MKWKLLAPLGAVMLVGASCVGTQTMSENVPFQTEDGVRIVGSWVVAGTDAPTALLLHMMPATKESYRAFASKLKDAGISSLAIDFRGHGESRTTADGRTLDYKTFSDVEHQAKIKDVEAALAWLEEKGIGRSRIGIVGASIGANLALQTMGQYPDIPVGVLLSPGLNYRGIATMPLIKSLSREQSIYLVASEEDRDSAVAVEKLAEVSLAKTNVKLFTDAGHGTTILDREPDFMTDLIAWLRARL